MIIDKSYSIKYDSPKIGAIVFYINHTKIIGPGSQPNRLPFFKQKAINLRAEKIIRDVAQAGSALRSGRRGRWFESSHPDNLESERNRARRDGDFAFLIK